MNNDDLCPHCDPYPNPRGHMNDLVDRWLFPLVGIFQPFEDFMKKYPRVYQGINRTFFSLFFGGLFRLGLLREVECDPLDDKTHIRTLLVAQEAAKRNVAVRALRCVNRGTNLYTIEINGKRKIFEGLPCFLVEDAFAASFDNKRVFKTILQQYGWPNAEGAAFRNEETAVAYARMLGWPLVVKPASSSLSKHATCNIRDEETLRAGIAIARQLGPEFMVERHIDGLNYRVTVVGGKLAAATRRELPNVIGDGANTIRELVEIKNADPLRGEQGQKNFPRSKLPVTARSIEHLHAQGLTLNDVPEAGRKVTLHGKVFGGDFHDVTDDMAHENVELFEKIARHLKAPVVGFDFIAEDIAIPWDKQKCGILEANSLPYIEIHHYPLTGKARNVAGAILDSMGL